MALHKRVLIKDQNVLVVARSYSAHAPTQCAKLTKPFNNMILVHSAWIMSIASVPVRLVMVPIHSALSTVTVNCIHAIPAANIVLKIA